MEFDEAKHYLGKLCKYGHDWDGTGQSLRLLKGKHCVECRKEISRKASLKYHHNNRDSCIGRMKRYRQENPEYFKVYRQQYQPTYYRKNRDKILQQAKIHRQNNPEKVKQQQQVYRKKNRNRLILYLREWRRLNFPKIVAYRKANPEKHRLEVKRRRIKKKEVHQVPYSLQELNNHFQQWDGRCAYCDRQGKIYSDHFIPLNAGGPDNLGNIIPCCVRCNSSKNKSEVYAWYSQQSFFSKRRWNKILRVLGKRDPGQLPLL